MKRGFTLVELLAVNAQLATDISSWHTSIKNDNARLISADEVAEITGNTIFNGTASTSASWFYFDTNTTTASTTCTSGNTTGCGYGWLYDRAYSSCTTYGCLNNANLATCGYWTSTMVAGGTTNAWRVSDYGRLNYNGVNFDGNYGVRPVITV